MTENKGITTLKINQYGTQLVAKFNYLRTLPKLKQPPYVVHVTPLILDHPKIEMGLVREPYSDHISQ